MSEIYSEIDVQTALHEQIEGKLLIDVRESDEFEAGHADGAVSIPLSEIKERLHEIDKSSAFNVICKSGGRSGQAATALNEAGFNATNVQGGSLEWLAVKQPFVSSNGDAPEVI